MKYKVFAKGKHSIVYISTMKNIRITRKKARNNKFIKNINKEAMILNLINQFNLGPKLIKKGPDYFDYVFVDGQYIKDWIKTASSSSKRTIAKKVLLQCYKLDKLKITKEEMNHPSKHIIISNKIVLIDFERAKFTKRPQNVTQFCQYLIKNEIMKFDRKILKAYKNDQNYHNFRKVLKMIK